MQAYVVSHEDWNLFLGHVMEDWVVVGPRQRPDQPGFHYFDHVKDPLDLTLDYTTTTIPPKKAFFPPTETLFRFTESNPPKIDRRPRCNPVPSRRCSSLRSGGNRRFRRRILISSSRDAMGRTKKTSNHYRHRLPA